mgnify:CR=1 FL=1
MQSAVKKCWCNIVRDEHNIARRSGKLRHFFYRNILLWYNTTVLIEGDIMSEASNFIIILINYLYSLF